MCHFCAGLNLSQTLPEIFLNTHFRTAESYIFSAAFPLRYSEFWFSYFVEGIIDDYIVNENL